MPNYPLQPTTTRTQSSVSYSGRVAASSRLSASVLALEAAIRKMTSMPAAQLGQPDLGVVREGAYADRTIWTPSRSPSGETTSIRTPTPSGFVTS
jgi:N-acyl-D-aspartate/D-glutamate deacylase